MKEDLPYFSHDNDARNHAKMKALDMIIKSIVK